jgi:hypothetical protein
MKKSILIILLLVVLLLLPLLINDNIYEFVCNYNLDDSQVTQPYSCENFFANAFNQVHGTSTVSVLNDPDLQAENYAMVVMNLIDKLDTCFTIKSVLPDSSYCEIDVVNEKIQELANLIKLTLVSLSNSFSYQDYITINNKLQNSNADHVVINDISTFLIEHAYESGVSYQFTERSARATHCKNQIYNDSTIYPECSIKGDNSLGLLSYANNYTGGIVISDIVK